MQTKPVVIGTRGSKLALYQANLTKATLEAAFPNKPVEIKIIKTKGDKILDVALSKIGDKGLFTKELEVALLNNEIDLAVHSLKDLPTSFPQGLGFGGVLARAEVRDALISPSGKNLQQLGDGAKIATSSLRRKAQLLTINPNFNIVDIRGNVQSRLQKLHDGYCDALIMAGAGFIRLGLENQITELIDPATIVPAVSQGAIAFEIRENDKATLELLNSINHTPTNKTVTAERAFLKKLEGGCQIPIGCYSVVTGNNIHITGFVASLDGTKQFNADLKDTLNNPTEVGQKLAQLLIDQGAAAILEEIRNATHN